MMIQLNDLLTSGLGVTSLLALLLFIGVVFVMRRRFAHIGEPALIQCTVLSFGFAGFYPLYSAHDYTWWAIVSGSILGFAPFLLLYRRSAVTAPDILEKRRSLAASSEFRVLVLLACGTIIAESLITLIISGFVITAKSAAIMLVREGGAIEYLSQAAVAFIPAFLLLTYRTRLFYFVIIAVVLNFAAATVAASKASFLWPVLMICAALFLRRLDRNTAGGWPAATVISLKNAALGCLGICAVLGLLWLAGLLILGDPSAFISNFFMRLFESLDGPFLAIMSSLVSAHGSQEYSVWLSYTSPVHKLLHLHSDQMYNNVGEYIAANVYHLNIWANPDFQFLPLPNSNLTLEFELSYPIAVALVLIPLYATAVISLMNWAERRRYHSIGYFCLSQYLIMNPLQFFTDGNYFVVAAYGAAALFVVTKGISVLIRVGLWVCCAPRAQLTPLMDD